MITSIWNYVAGSSQLQTNSLSPSSLRGQSGASTSPRAPKPEYSVNYLQGQIEELLSVTGSADSPRTTIPASQIDRLVELIRSIAETLLWGEQNEEDSLMFDYFCEKGVMKVFVSLLNSPTVQPTTSLFAASTAGNRQVKIQLLQTMSLLLLNVKRQTSLYFLFSNNSINQLVNNNNNLDFSDEEILSYYVSLVKSIALRLSGETMQFFMNDKNSNYFPIFNQSIRFFDHHDRMVRIAVRTITLSIFKLYSTSEGLERFLLDNAGGYFSLLACQLRDLWYLVDRTIAPQPGDEQGNLAATLTTVMDEMIDQLEYIAEIERLGIDPLNEMLWEKLNVYAVDSVLMPGMLPDESGDKDPKRISRRVALFVLIQILETFNLNPICSKLVTHFVTNSKLEKDLKQVSSVFPLLVMLFTKLSDLAAVNEELRTPLTDLGLLPPGSIQLTILTAQLLAKALDSMSVKSVHITLLFLSRYLSSADIPDEFKRPVKITIIDSFRTLSMRMSQLAGNGLLQPRVGPDKVPTSPPSSNQMDYSVIDLFESVLTELSTDPSLLTIDSISKLVEDPELLLVALPDWTVPIQPVDTVTAQNLKVYFTILHFVKTQFGNKMDFESVRNDLFTSKPDEGHYEAVNSPSTPSSEYIESESLATDRKSDQADAKPDPVPFDVIEGSSIDLGKRDRIVCTHITSSLGRSTRYLILDRFRVILVAPDLVRPGYASIKYIEMLRRFKSVAVSRDDQRILKLTLADGTEERLGFEDLKRCHLALMHLETQRIEIRKGIFRNIDAMIKGFIHYI